MKSMNLVPVDECRDLPLLVQAAPVPVIAGVQPSGSDVFCPSCRRSLLLRQVIDGEIHEVAFRCGCGALCAAPRLPAGQAIPMAVRPIGPGEHPVAETLVNDVAAMVVGAPALERRLAVQRDRQLSRPKLLMDAHGIAAVRDRARAMFAPIVRQLEGRYAAQLSAPRASDASRHHRLPQLLAAVERTLDGVKAGSHEVDVLAVTELETASMLFGRWADDPAWSRLIAECKAPEAFDHNLAVLAFASALDESRLGVELVAPGPTRTADLRLRIALARDLAFEVKAPLALQRRAGIPARRAELDDVVEKAVRSAGSQLGGTPAVLGLGGASWNGDLDALDRVAARFWSRRGRQKPLLMGFLFLARTFAWKPATEPVQGQPVPWHEVDFSWQNRFLWVPNPGYRGPLQMSFSRDFVGPFDLAYHPALPEAIPPMVEGSRTNP